MATRLATILSTLTLFSAAAIAHAAPTTLDDEAMDQVAAGSAYSMVTGAGTAQQGIVSVKTFTSAVDKPHGADTTKAVLLIREQGTGLSAYGYGESGANGAVASSSGAADVAQGGLFMLVTTKSKTLPNGNSMVSSSTIIVTSGKGGMAFSANASRL
jgi:hypothetical protein